MIAWTIFAMFANTILFVILYSIYMHDKECKESDCSMDKRFLIRPVRKKNDNN